MYNYNAMAKHDGLLEEIETDARWSLKGGQRFYLADLSCSVGSICASFLAAILAVISNQPVWLTASIAAMPGLFTALQRVVDLRGRGQWYLSRATHLRMLGLMFKHGKLTDEEAVIRFADIEIEMDRRWTELIGASTTILRPVANK
jgi:hypothetical protein